MQQKHLDIIEAFFQKFQARDSDWPAILGDGAGNVAVPNRPGWVYVRMPDNSSVQAYNGGRVQEVEDLAVTVGYTHLNPFLFRVLDVRHTYQDALPYTVLGPHAASHTHLELNGGNDVIWIDARQFMPMRIGPATGLSIQIYRTVIWNSTGWAVLEGTLDLTANVPGSGARYVLVAVDSSGTVQLTNGSTVVGLVDLTEGDIPTLPEGQTPLGAVALYAGQTDIVENNLEQDFNDLRFGGAPGAGTPPITASYVTVSVEAGLPNERRLAAGNLITLTDGGAGSTLTTAVDSTKLTITAGKLDKLGAGTLTLSAPSAATLTVDASMELDSTSAVSGRLLQYNGTKWVAVAVSGDATLASGGALTLANTAVTPGTYGDATNVAQITVDSKGRLTAATNVPITFPATGGWTDDGTVVRLTTSTDKVGIGTTSPTGKVDILGTLTVASGASAVLRDFWMEPATITLTGSTGITTVTGFNFSEFGIPTYSAASALAVSYASTVYIAGAPAGVGAGPATITNPYALWVDAGNVRMDGRLGIGVESPSAALHAISTGGLDTLRLGFDLTNYVSFTVSSSGGNLTIAPTGGDTLITGRLISTSATMEQLSLNYDASHTTAFTTGSTGDLTIAPSGSDTFVTGNLDVSSHAAIGGSASVNTAAVLKITETFTDPGSNILGIDVTPNVTLTANNAFIHIGVNMSIGINQNGNNLTSTAFAMRGMSAGVAINGASGTVTSAAGAVGVINNTGAGTITTGYGVVAAANTNSGGGTFTNSVGIRAVTQTVGTNNIQLVLGNTIPTGNWSIYSATGYNSYLDSPLFINVTAAFGAEWLSILAPDNGTCLGLKINATQANITASDIFAQFRSTSGVEGSIAGTGVAGVIAYNTFTGAHWAQLELSEPEPEIGMIVSVSGKMVDNFGSERRLPFVRRSAGQQDKAAFGVYAGSIGNSGEIAHGKEGANLSNVLSIGIGVILVTSTGGDIEPGDYIQPSPKPGLGEKQPDDVLHSYTVAKALEYVNWDQEKETNKLVSCTYHCS